MIEADRGRNLNNEILIHRQAKSSSDVRELENVIGFKMIVQKSRFIWNERPFQDFGSEQ